MKSKIISIANHKGGVGKTTSTASIGAALALSGRKVLLVDLDAQQNLTFMITQQEDPEVSVYHSLVNDSPLPIVSVGDVLDIVPASLDLARAEIDMATRIAREGILRDLLAKYANGYDYILIDCPPSLGIVTTNALVASNYLLIPLTAEALPFKGLSMLEEVVGEVKRRVNPNLEIGGVFFTRYFNRNLNKEIVNVIIQKFGDLVFSTKIRENISLAEMPLSGVSIFNYDPKSNGASDYRDLAKEIISRCEH